MTRFPAEITADPRIPAPDTRTAPCRSDPTAFAIEELTGRTVREQALARAMHACSTCPVATDCLKWALANPELTTTGVWAATTPRKRNELRRRLVDRLGDDWVGAVTRTGRDRAT
ncbi:WhiB family transcriptional regulator [Streptomyces sp. NPDC017941]|uniref:WhiB family transcriptional regulator n=1 Tax=unclassified Streptomyces TaxID=2593676 RepID=UPI0037B9D218